MYLDNNKPSKKRTRSFILVINKIKIVLKLRCVGGLYQYESSCVISCVRLAMAFCGWSEV